jgi:hypothetical protein
MSQDCRWSLSGTLGMLRALGLEVLRKLGAMSVKGLGFRLAASARSCRTFWIRQFPVAPQYSLDQKISEIH